MNLYDILGVKKDAKGPEIKKAYRNKARENHPDNGGSDAMMASINLYRRIAKNPLQNK